MIADIPPANMIETIIQTIDRTTVPMAINDNNLAFLAALSAPA